MKRESRQESVPILSPLLRSGAGLVAYGTWRPAIPQVETLILSGPHGATVRGQASRYRMPESGRICANVEKARALLGPRLPLYLRYKHVGHHVPVAVKVTGEPVRPALVAVSVLAPAGVPSVQLVTAAIPLESVTTAVVGTTTPPPEATAKVTLTPATTLLFTSLTMTLGNIATAAPATAV